jgi:aminoglycoside 3-N-acetyltransferase
MDATPEFSIDSLTHDLQQLGIVSGDVLWIHSSLRAIGPVAGGADAVIGALLASVGPGGSVLMPVFNLVPRARRAETWRYPDTPSTTGYLTERFRLWPGTVRSDHYSHSVAAWGARSEWFVSGHRDQLGPTSPWDLQPWGRTFGSESPFMRLYQSGAKVLMLGVDYNSATFKHLIETLAHHKNSASDTHAVFDYLDPSAIGSWWDSHGSIRTGTVGQANCKIFSASSFVDRLLGEVTAHPHRYFASKMTQPRA